MALPKLSQPVFELTIPSTKKKVRYHPFTVKEEKLLLFAQASGERDDYVNAFKQLITNCCIDEIDVDKLASFDIEYFFLKLRARSVSNKIKLKVVDKHDKEVDVEVDLDAVQVYESQVSNKIVLDPAAGVGIKLKYPTFNEIAVLAKRDDGEVTLDDGLNLFISLIELIWEGDSVYVPSDYTKEELVAFVDGFNSQQVEQVEAFLEDLPYVYLDVDFIDSAGEEQNHRIVGIESFFA